MNRFLLSPFLLLAIVAGFLAGCYSTDRRDGRGRDLDAAVERAKEAPAFLTGDQVFFDGKVKVTALVSRGFGGGPHERAGGEERRPAGHFGMGHRTGPGDFPPEEAGDDRAPMHMAEESHMPPVMIRLRFQNLTNAPLTVDIFDFTSALGDFAVRPEKLTIPASGSAEPDAMTSRLGLAGQNLSIKLVLYLNGTRDERTLTLHQEVPHER